MRYLCIFYTAPHINEVSKKNKKVVVVELEAQMVDNMHPSPTIITMLKSERNATFVKYIRSMETERLLYHDSDWNLLNQPIIEI